MNIIVKNHLEYINEMAASKGYTLNIVDTEAPIDIGAGPGHMGLASHYVDYGRKAIIITLPLEHEEKEAFLLHELIHAEFFLKGFPRINRSVEIQVNEFDSFLFNSIEDMVQHKLLYPKMEELNVMHDKRNLDAIQQDLTNLLEDDNTNVIVNSFRMVDCFYINSDEFLKYEPRIRSEYPKSYQMYRNLKKVLSPVRSPLTAREAIIKIFGIIEQEATRYNSHYDFKEKVLLKPVIATAHYNKVVSELFQLVQRPELTHFYLLEKRTGYYVEVLNSTTTDFEREKETLNRESCKDYLSLLE